MALRTLEREYLEVVYRVIWISRLKITRYQSAMSRSCFLIICSASWG